MALYINDLRNIFLPVLGHWQIWFLFLIIVIVVCSLYAWPYFKKPRKDFRNYHIGIPITNIIALYIFTKLLEGVLYQGAILKVDLWFNKTMVALHTSWLTSIAFFVTSFGTGLVIVILVIITIGILFLRKRWRFALLSLVAILTATVLQIIIKDLVNRIRPPNSLENISPGLFSASFPSGHAITAIVYVSLLVYSYRDDIKQASLKYFLITIASSFFILVAFSRIYLNAHWFSDVIAGMSLGLFWFMFVVLIERSSSSLMMAVRRESKEAKPLIPELKLDV